MRGEADVEPNAWAEIDPARPDVPRAPSVLIGVAAAALVAGFLVWRGHRVAALVLVGVVATITVARRLSPRFDRAFARALARVAHVVGIALSWFALGLTMLFVIVPVWAISRLARWNVLEPEPRHGRWADHRLPPWRQRPDRGFADERRPLPARTRLHGVLTALVPLVLLAAALTAFRDPLLAFAGRVTPGHLVFGGGDQDAPPPASASAPVSTPTVDGIAGPTGDPPDGYPRNVALAHGADPWAADYYNQYFPVVFGFDPYLTVRAADRREEYVNVTDRVRASYRPEGADTNPDALDVWFFGGSALFGQGQRDEHTLPSEIARLAEADGMDLRVHNFGVPGYWAWQDALLLAQLLSERPDPDLIVMYEGYNDIASTLPAGSPMQASTGFADQVRQVLTDAGASFAGAESSAVDTMPRTTVRSPQNAATVFGRAADLARDLAAVNDIPIAQYLQPSIWLRDLPVDDASLANIGADREYHASNAVGWNQARALMAVDGVVDLGDSLDDLDELVYNDDVHINEVGTRAVAEALYADLRPTIEALYGGSGPDAD